jgi:hypothetical protein
MENLPQHKVCDGLQAGHGVQVPRCRVNEHCAIHPTTILLRRTSISESHVGTRILPSRILPLAEKKKKPSIGYG